MSNDPSVNLNKLVQNNIRYEYPKGIGVVKGLQHFMIIRELEFKEPEKSKDGFNGQTITENIIGSNNQLDFYELKRAFVLHLPPGSLKTQYSADYQDVNLGIFGEILSQNVNQITDNVAKYYDDFKNNKLEGGLTRTAQFYRNVGESADDQLSPYVNSSGLRDDFVNRIKFNVTSAFGNLARLGGSNAKGEQVASLSMQQARNPYTSLIFAGIKKLREFTFNFDFNPKNSIESENIMKILANLKHGALPSLPHTKIKKDSVEVRDESYPPEERVIQSGALSGTTYTVPNPPRKTYKVVNQIDSAFFKYPSVYTINFYSNMEENKNLYRIGNSFLTSIKIKYTPDFFEENGMPTSINAQLSFRENFALDRSHAEDY